ncbi:MAG: hypothetical protein GXY38_01275 [Planctomycetes bacterium]|jgi:hypothetical protein|nr:hypothetical protein [Planctomycetota bacterium]
MASEEDSVETLEAGDIYFFYRPKVEKEDVTSASDVQRVYLVLSPDAHDRYRLAVLGRKKLPDPSQSGKRRYWCFIETVSKHADGVREALQAEEYETKTRGRREVPAARPVGEGRYRLLRHNGHTHLAYALELPHKPGGPQDDFNIEQQASYIISVKNPDKPTKAPAGLGKNQKADYPKHLQERFGDRSFSDADPDLLDYEGAEFVLISAAEDVKEELGVEIDTEKEDQSSADVFSDLELDRREHPARPLVEAKWK